MSISGRYIRTRATQLITDRIRVFQNEDAGIGEQDFLNKNTQYIKTKSDQNPQMEYNWVVRLPDIYTNNPDTTVPDIYQQPDSKIETDRIAHRIDSITSPLNQFEIEKNTDGTSFMYTATHGDIGSITAVVDEYEDGATLTYFNDWQQKIRNPDGTHNVPAFYKKDVIIYDLDSIKLETHAYIYKGLWPASIEANNKSQTGNGKHQYTVNLSVDSVQLLRISPSMVLDRLNNVQEDIVRNVIDSSGLSTNAPDFLVDTLDTIVGVRDLIF